MKLGRQVEQAATAGVDDPAVNELREQARLAQAARRKVFVARLPMPDDPALGEVSSWSAAVHQVQMHGYELTQWSVCPEPEGPVAYAVFTAS